MDGHKFVQRNQLNYGDGYLHDSVIFVETDTPCDPQKLQSYRSVCPHVSQRITELP